MVDRHPLLFGPYSAPRVKIGDVVFCEFRGRVVVVGSHEARICWPVGLPVYGDKSSKSIILYGDLVRAVRNEAAETLKYWWGVSKGTVTKWRQTLSVGRVTAGTRTLLSEANSTPERLEFVRRMSDKAASFEVRLKTVQAAEARGYYNSSALPWPEEHVAMLGTMSDRDVARRIGRPAGAVAWHRRKLSIPPFYPSGVPAKNVERLAPISHTKLRQRRLLSGLTQREVAGRIGVSDYRVCEFERLDGHFADVEVVAALADALQCAPSDILQDGWDLAHPPKCPVDRHGNPLTPAQVHPLRDGPYHAPDVCVGEKLECVFHGVRTVKRFSDAPIPWPIAEETGCKYIVCGDLVRALADETFRSVMYWWDVTPSTVSAWRRGLGLLK